MVFGLGTSLSNAKVIDNAMDITEVEGKLWCPKYGKEMIFAFIKYIVRWKYSNVFKNVSEVRKRVMDNLKKFTLQDFNI
ncbi:MAG: hypothetical protein ABDH49_00720 [Candidatus Hydrothermales bacterium]